LQLAWVPLSTDAQQTQETAQPPGELCQHNKQNIPCQRAQFLLKPTMSFDEEMVDSSSPHWRGSLIKLPGMALGCPKLKGGITAHD
jgi:hypothetical protein